eukprot:508826-Rhodomonas_salina.2
MRKSERASELRHPSQQRQTDRQTEGQTETETETDRDRDRDRDRQSPETETETDRETETERQRQRDRDRETETETEIETEIETDRRKSDRAPALMKGRLAGPAGTVLTRASNEGTWVQSEGSTHKFAPQTSACSPSTAPTAVGDLGSHRLEASQHIKAS